MDKLSLKTIRERSALAWQGAIESAQRDHDTARETRVRAAYKRAMDAFALAHRHLDALHGALNQAQQLAMDFGDDAPEREAIDALPYL